MTEQVQRGEQAITVYRLIGSVHTLTGLPGATSQFLRGMDSVRKGLATSAGLTVSELRTMAMVAESDGVTPKHIAEGLEVTTGAVTAIANGLVSRGLVVRVEQPHDRRSVLLHLTAEGHALMKATYRDLQNVLAATTRSLGADDTAALIRGLQVMASEIERLR